MNANDLKLTLFGNQYKGQKSRNVFHMCGTLREELGAELFEASNNLNWLMSTGRLNPPYLLALREGTAQQVCNVIVNLQGVVSETNMIKAVESSIKPVKV
ncbi:hypothetical protein H6F86_20710 [Phormidium sp. FACHB-592]|uniref:Uncharacterized protein n=1 Tax=Stenomitos frigidus AS-A4 TaxID=2933935 RepID=A0ABV0KGY5_9CYAN|nr:hypothetical protein [Phormidium sp. FACHB-592]MBD2076255.1 hypothetical protein [Phormidium sp. FACHB-592]